MGVRGIIRDLLGIYLGYKIIAGAWMGGFTLSPLVVFSGVVLLILGIWFILERVGILAQMNLGE